MLLIESLQLAVLAAAAILLFAKAAGRNDPFWIWTLFLATACFAAFCRELDPDLYAGTDFAWIMYFGRKIFYRFAIGASGGLLVAAVLVKAKGFRKLVKPTLLITVGIAIFLMIAGSALEKQGAMLVEECLELSGQVFVLAAAWLYAKDINGPLQT